MVGWLVDRPIDPSGQAGTHRGRSTERNGTERTGGCRGHTAGSVYVVRGLMIGSWSDMDATTTDGRTDGRTVATTQRSVGMALGKAREGRARTVPPGMTDGCTRDLPPTLPFRSIPLKSHCRQVGPFLCTSCSALRGSCRGGTYDDHPTTTIRMTRPPDAHRRAAAAASPPRPRRPPLLPALLRPRHVNDRREPLLSSPYRPSARDRWDRLRQYVQSGEVLVAAQPHTHDEDDDDDMAAQYGQWLAHTNLFSLKQCLVGILLWVTIAVVAFRTVFGGHNWTIIDCIYFSVVTFTTVGFGDLVPETPAAKVFTMLYAASGVVWLSVIIGVLGSNVLEAQELAMDRLHRHPSPPTKSLRTHDTRQGWLDRLLPAIRIQPTSSTAKIVKGALYILMVLVLFGILISFDPALRHMPHVDVPYFVAVSAVTCGYGDVVPTSQWGRLATALFIPLIVATTAHWMKFIAKRIINRRNKQFRIAMARRQLSYQDLQRMDDNEDGHVSRADFLEFMLLAMGKIDHQLILELREHFARIDTDNNGCLCRHELIVMARHTLQEPRRKLELARYKAHLLRVAKVPGSTEPPAGVAGWNRVEGPHGNEIV